MLLVLNLGKNKKGSEWRSYFPWVITLTTFIATKMGRKET